MLGLGVVALRPGAAGRRTTRATRATNTTPTPPRPPGHELPASAKTHAVVEAQGGEAHRKVARELPPRARAREAPREDPRGPRERRRPRLPRRATSRRAEGLCRAQGQQPDLVGRVLQLGPDDCMPPSCEPGMRCAEFNEVETDALVYSNLANKGPNNNCQENPVPGKTRVRILPLRRGRRAWRVGRVRPLLGDGHPRQPRGQEQRRPSSSTTSSTSRRGSEVPCEQPDSERALIAAQGEAMLQINLKTSKEIAPRCAPPVAPRSSAASPRHRRAPRARLGASPPSPSPPPRAATPVAPPHPSSPLPLSAQASFVMAFYKHGTTEPMELDVFTVWYTDLDISKYGGGPKPGQETLVMQTPFETLRLAKDVELYTAPSVQGSTMTAGSERLTASFRLRAKWRGTVGRGERVCVRDRRCLRAPQ